MAPKVLMLEDDLTIVKMVGALMQKEGFDFKAVHLASQALATANRFNPDLILLDVELPDGSGFKVCESLRLDPGLGDVPIIFITGQGDTESRLKGFAAGGQDYVPKPFALDELRARIRAHLAVKKRLDKASAAKTAAPEAEQRLRQDLADMVLHDLKAPIGTIKITLSMLRDSGLIAKTDYDLLVSNAQAAADVVLFMVNDLVDVTKGELKVEVSACELPELTQRLGSLFAAQLALRKMKLELTEDELPTVELDPVLVLRVLANLLSNAMKFSGAGSVIRLAVSRKKDRLRFELSDQGPGIPDAEKEKIFEMRYRVESALTKQVPGSGIGLAFCRKACESLGGRIWVEDGQGGGSRFVVELPFVPASGPKA